MRGSYCIAVVFLHDFNIKLQIVKADCVSLCHMCIVVVNALKFNCPVIKKENLFFDFNMFKTKVCADCFNFFAVIEKGYCYFIKLGNFSAPFLSIK